MGYRIELEEIENALMLCQGVIQTAVVYHRVNEAYGKIIAFITSDTATNEEEVLRSLSELVPNYMVPSKVFVMTHLPKNANGKVDRKHLLANLKLDSL